MNYSNQSEFTVTLLSNSSFDIHPENTIFNFTNELASPLHLPSNEDWQVCLSSISITNVVLESERIKKYRDIRLKKLLNQVRLLRGYVLVDDNETNLKKYARASKLYNDFLRSETDVFNNKNPVFVECGEISPKFGESKILTCFIAPPYKGDGSDNFIHYHPITEEYFSFSSPILNSISISVKNSSGKLLESNIAQPTIIVLKFKKMALHTTDYHTMYLNNGAQSPTDFNVKLPQSLVKDGHQNPWEIALTRISFTPLLKPFPTGDFFIKIYKTELKKYNLVTKAWYRFITYPHETVKFSYPSGIVKKTLIPFLLSVLQPVFQKINVDFKLEYDSTKKKCYMQAGEDLVLLVPETLVCVLGYDAPGIEYHEGYGYIPLKGRKKTYSIRDIDVHFMLPQNLLLYTNCVAPSLIGNVLGTYLTNFPVPKPTEKIELPYISYSPKNLEFHKLQASDLK